MTQQQHPINPPPELVEQWQDESPERQIADHIQYLATRAAQWGAGQELEACCEWLNDYMGTLEAGDLRAARRPKPPSLKEQALDELDGIAAVFRMSHGGDLVCNKIRRALEQLDD